MFDLTGKRGIVTGGSSGIGLEVAQVLAEAGAQVYAWSRSGAPRDGREIHPGIHHLQADVNDYQQAARLVEEMAAEGGIDFLVNNAGITYKCRAEQFPDEEFDRILQTNVKSLFKLSCLCYPHLKKAPARGRVVNISSMAAHLGFSEVVPYCISKSAVLGLTRGLAVEWAEDHINVNSVAPGWFPSELTKKVMDPQRQQKILARMPVHKYGHPRDIGAMICYLLSDEAEYVTGQDMAVDGGALAFGY
ncbi:MAG: SDR family NAD(P)-dependent oxidoreductase [Eubacteriales bacterium]